MHKPKPSGLTFWPLVIATFFMVSGGTYGTEDIVRGAGYLGAVLVLLITPLLWSVPTTLMIGELSAAIPAEGGYYVWVRRALGNFWGFQEAWLSLVASIFDMAIYPALFVAYLARLEPSVSPQNWRGMLAGIAVIAVCAALNLAGVRVVALTSVWMFAVLSLPFAIVVLVAPFRHVAVVPAAPVENIGLLGGIMVAMWNYMGWDNASTVAGEVHDPKHTYPRAMLTAVAVVALSYILPVAAMARTGIPPGAWETGSWADLAGMLAGRWLFVFVVLGGMTSGFGMFNSLVLSYSRVPLAMAEDGMLPRVFGRLVRRTGAPWVSILVLSIAWALCLRLRFERLITLDILLYGGSLTLEFIALLVLRVREPRLPRPFRVPGGLAGAAVIAALPVALLALSIVSGGRERVWGMNALLFGAILAGLGCVLFPLTRYFGRRAQAAPG